MVKAKPAFSYRASHPVRRRTTTTSFCGDGAIDRRIASRSSTQAAAFQRTSCPGVERALQDKRGRWRSDGRQLDANYANGRITGSVKDLFWACRVYQIYWPELSSSQPAAFPFPSLRDHPALRFPHGAGREKEGCPFSELGGLRMVSHLCCRCQPRLKIALPSRPIGPGRGPHPSC